MPSTQILRIAIFKPDEQHLPRIGQLFQRPDYGVRWVTTPAEIIELIHDEADIFDAIIAPVRMFDGSSGLAIAAQLKAEPQLASMPLIAISLNDDGPVRSSLFQAGADFVPEPNFDADELHFLIAGLGRLSRQTNASMQASRSAEYLLSLGLAKTNLLPEAIFLTDLRGKLIFVNYAGRALFGADAELGPAVVSRIEGSLVGPLKAYREDLRYRPHEARKGADVFFDVFLSITRDVQVNSKITSIVDPHRGQVGYGVLVHENAQDMATTERLAQGERMRALLLGLAAHQHAVLSPKTGSKRTSPLTLINSAINQSPAPSSLLKTITAVLEFIDPILNPAVGIKVSIRDEVRVVLREAHLFQLIGFIVLHSLDFTAGSGDCIIQVIEGQTANELTLLFVTTARASIEHLSAKEFSARPKDNENAAASKIPTGLVAAQQIAELYRSQVEYQRSSDTSIKVRVRLPISVARQA